jgi:hypothetical protein
MHPDLLPSHPTWDLRDFFFLLLLIQTSLGLYADLIFFSSVNSGVTDLRIVN